MIFEHIVIDSNEYPELNNNEYDNEGHDTGGVQKYIFLDDKNVPCDEYAIVAQAISLDIRGDYSFFLNNETIKSGQPMWKTMSNNSNKYEKRKESKYQRKEYEWTGNMFHIIVNEKYNIVKIIDMSDEENRIYEVEYNEWEEALLDWKEFYLSELGFMEFDSLALSHMFGTLILIYDQMGDGIYISDMLTEAIKKASNRYGVAEAVIYRDCKKVTGVYSIDTFGEWVAGFLQDNKYRHRYAKNSMPYNVLEDFVRSNIYNCQSDEEKDNRAFEMRVREYFDK